MEFRVLGSLDVVDGNRVIALPGRQPKALLANLLVHRNRVVPSTQLVDDLWHGRPPAGGLATLATYVRDLRRALEPDGDARTAQVLVTRRPGYALMVPDDALDASRFVRGHEVGQRALERGEFEVASRHLAAALALWTDAAFGELASEPCVIGEATRLDELRLACTDDRIAADLALGAHRRLVPELEALVEQHPFRERFWAHLMLALYRDGRQTEALRAFARVRAILVGELGIEPGAELATLERAVLQRRDELDAGPTPATAAVAEPRVAVPLVNPPVGPPELDLDPTEASPAPGWSAHRGTGGLVGREAELSWLRGRLDALRSGRPLVVLIRGAPGVGKTRLMREVLRSARGLGVAVAFGRCQQHYTMPYLPLVDDLFERLRGLSEESGALDPATTAALETLWSPTAAPVGEAALAVALRHGIGELVRRQPLVLAVDDLQWADPATLELIGSLVRMLADHEATRDVPLAVVISVRDHGLDTRIERALASIVREEIVSTLELSGLDDLEVYQLVRQLGLAAGQRWTRELSERTRGNPLFVTTIVSRLLHDGIEPEQLDSGLPVALPEVIDDAISGRLDVLGPVTRDLLDGAAVLGHQWDGQRLQMVCGIHAAEVAAHLDEARRAGVLEQGAGIWRFTHPLFVQACRSRLDPDRRRSLHAAVAQGLLELSSTTTDVSDMEIAHHLLEGRPDDDVVATEVFVRAADQAHASCAWSDAARYYEAALAIVERADAEGDRVARLRHRAGVCHLNAGEPVPAGAHLRVASGLLDAEAEPDVAALAAVWIDRVQLHMIAGPHEVPPDNGPLEKLVPELESTDPAMAARVHSNLAQSYWAAGRLAESRAAALRAVELGEPLGAHLACEEGHRAVAMTQWITLSLEDSLATLEQARRHAERTGDPKRMTGPMMRLPMNLAWLGRFDDVARAARDAVRVSRQVNYTLENGLVLCAEALVAAAQGRFAHVEALAHRIEVLEEATGYPWATPMMLPTLAWIRSAQGDVQGAEDVLERWAPADIADGGHRPAARILRLLLDADPDRPSPALRQLAGSPDAIPMPRMMGAETTAALCVELAAVTGQPALAAGAGELLDEVDAEGQRFTTTMGLLIPRVLGAAAVLRGDGTAAHAHLDKAIRIATRLQAHAELARARLTLGELLLADGEWARARRQLEASSELARALAMQPVRERAERLIVDLPVGATRRAIERDHAVELAAVLFVDIANSTGLTEQLGDWAFRTRARRLERDLRDAVARHGGRAVEGITLGDGVASSFASAASAVSCALESRDAGARADLPVHVGMHVGEVIRDGGKVFGTTVNTAARVCSESEPSQVLITGTARELLGPRSELTVVDLGSVALRGLTEPVQIFSIEHQLQPIEEIAYGRHAAVGHEAVVLRDDRQPHQRGQDDGGPRGHREGP
jgi:DNA-binding SARP family transcriptional activator/class 3 adenylate cyclase